MQKTIKQSESKQFLITKTLVIVESPAKCAKIESYLGPGYKVIASFGHLREIASLKDIDIEKGFTVTYSIVDDERKKKHVEWMRNEIAQADEVILATDADREGEAIAWHICDLFGLSVNKTKRIVFQEITETALQKAIQNPGILNMSLVESQKTRQILDFLVGYTVSPTLWEHISSSFSKKTTLSAGRCQTPALQLVYENDQEMKKAVAKTIFKTTGYFTSLHLPFSLCEPSFNEREDVLAFMEETDTFCHILSVSLPKRILYAPPLALTTSRLQQRASNECHFSPKETMKMAQTLYEEGYITYMRTDSEIYCDEFLASAKEWILRECNDPSFLSLTLFSSSKKKESAPHEAIRPTDIRCRQLSDNETLTVREKRLYKLIWQTTVESCMSAAEYDTITAIISAPQQKTYEYKCEQVVFSGYRLIQKKGLEDSKEYSFLSREKRDKRVECLGIISEMIMVEQKQHYTEARLVHLLEERGIGRPSTFASLIEKIQERNYVAKRDIPGKEMDSLVIQWSRTEKGKAFVQESSIKKVVGAEKNKLVLQPTGFFVSEFLSQHFSALFRYEYTNEMEAALDAIREPGEGIAICETCYTLLKDLVVTMKKETNENKKHIEIDERHTFLIGKNGPVVKKKDIDGIVTFLSVKPDIDIDGLRQGSISLADIVVQKENTNCNHIIGEYEGKSISVQKGKYGWYARWGEENVSLSFLGNRPVDNVSLEEVIAIIQQSKTSKKVVRKITDTIDIRCGEYGDYIFYKTERMKRPAFYKLDGFVGDYKTGHIDLLKRWIRDTYQLSL